MLKPDIHTRARLADHAWPNGRRTRQRRHATLQQIQHHLQHVHVVPARIRGGRAAQGGAP
jgi:hypothetical protein